ncbi:MAG: hypothetical protein LIO87_09680 [Eubacterium sp.]|nr:hypothetical protein [Eubacterium sp.]
MKKTIKIISITALIASMNVTAFAAVIPRESAPENADEGAIIITENLIGDILDEVESGNLAYTLAAGYANARIRKAAVAGETDGYGYGILSPIAQNAARTTRDMYLRSDYYNAVEEEVKVIIADIITEVKNGKPYDEALNEAYTAIYQSKDASYDTANYEGIDFCYYPDTPAIDSVYFNRARKLLLAAVKN